MAICSIYRYIYLSEQECYLNYIYLCDLECYLHSANSGSDDPFCFALKRLIYVTPSLAPACFANVASRYEPLDYGDVSCSHGGGSITTFSCVFISQMMAFHFARRYLSCAVSDAAPQHSGIGAVPLDIQAASLHRATGQLVNIFMFLCTHVSPLHPARPMGSSPRPFPLRRSVEPRHSSAVSSPRVARQQAECGERGHPQQGGVQECSSVGGEGSLEPSQQPAKEPPRHLLKSYQRSADPPAVMHTHCTRNTSLTCTN